MKTSIWLLCLFVITHLASGVAFAQVPSTISYQGILTGAEGQPVEDGSYDMHFRLYSGSGTQTVIWEETRSVTVQNGLFSVLLGTINPLDLPFDQPYYLGLAVGEAPELSPRMALTSSAYSFRARTIDDGQVVTSLNGLRDNVSLVAGDNIGLTQNDSTIVISALINAGEGTITGITAGEGLTGGGTAGVVTLSVAEGGVTSSMLADSAVTAHKLASGSVTEAALADSIVTGAKIHPDIDIATTGTIQAGSFVGDGSGLTGLPVVNSLNGLRDNVTLVAGDNIGLTQNDSTIVISAQIDAGEGTITGITAGEGLTGGGTAGEVTLSVAEGGVTSSMLADSAVTAHKLASGSVTEAALADSIVTGAKIHPDIDITTTGTITAGSFVGDGSGLTGLPVVNSLNGLRDNVSLVAGDNIGLTQNDSTIVISALINAGEGTITGITAGEGLTGGGTAGVVTLSVAEGGVTSSMLADSTVTAHKLAPGSVTGSAIADSAVTATKIHPDIDITTTGTIQAGSFTGDGSGLTGLPAGEISLPITGEVNGEPAAISVTNTSASGVTFGLRGQSSSTSGRGVYGLASATNGVTFGVRGESSSTDGRGVSGLASATNGVTYGVEGRSSSVLGRGVFGVASATSGGTAGVEGLSSSTNGRGVSGFASAGNGENYGVYGQSLSTSGWGVLGFASAASGNTIGVEGRSNSTDGRGVYGSASAGSGTNYGVFGYTSSPEGYAAYFAGAAGSKNYFERRVGIGIENPLELLHIGGALLVGNTSNSNTGTIRWTGTDFQGRTSNQWVSLTGNSAYIRVTPDTDPNRAPTIVAGHPSNSAGADDSSGSIIAGGGLGDKPNSAGSAVYSTISGGAGNRAIMYNYSVIGGGFQNKTVGGYSTIGGGLNNITGNFDDPFQGQGQFATIGGGSDNLARGLASTVPGGAFNSANGAYSLAAGRRAKAVHDGTFTWADATNADFTSTGNNQYLIRAAGGVGINTNSPRAMLTLRGPDHDTFGPNMLLFGNTNDQFESGRIRFVEGTALNNWRGGYIHFDGQGNMFHIGVHPTSDNDLQNDINAITITRTGIPGVGIGTTSPGSFRLAVNGDAAKPGGGSWSVFSDQRLKNDIQPLDHGSLDRLLSINGYTFEYHDEAIENRLALPGRQTGLIAQEVLEVFPDWVGTDEEGYLYVTERGLTAQLIEALRELRQEKDAHIEQLILKNRALEERLEREKSELATRLETEKQALEARLEREKYELATRLENIEAALGIPSPAMKAQN